MTTSKHQLSIQVIEPTSPELLQYDVEEGKISLTINPGIKSTLRLKIKNENQIEKQAQDDEGHKLGLVIKSIEFLRMDQNFTLTGTYIIMYVSV